MYWQELNWQKLAEKYGVTIKYHRLIRPLTPKEFEALKLSIDREGQYQKIVKTPQNVILDGHHRLRICDELKLAPEYEIKPFKSELEEKLYVREVNTKRRQLSHFELIEQGLKSEEIIQERRRLKQIAEEHEKAGLPLGSFEPRVNVDKETAKRLGVSKTTLVRSRYIIKHGSKELKAKIREGERTITSAYEQVKRAAETLELPNWRKVKFKEGPHVFELIIGLNGSIPAAWHLERDLAPQFRVRVTQVRTDDRPYQTLFSQNQHPLENSRFIIQEILKKHTYKIDFDKFKTIFQTEISGTVAGVITTLANTPGDSKITTKHRRALEKMTLEEIIEWILPHVVAERLKP